MPSSGGLRAPPPLDINPRRLIGRSVDSRLFTAQPGGQSDITTVPGQLGTWQQDVSRPYANLGKFPISLTSTPALEAGGFSPFRVQTTPTAGERAPGQIGAPQPGFWESAIGGLFGVFGDGAGDIGRFAGSVIDFPMEAAGNLLALPSAPFNAAWLGGREAPLDEDLQKAWDDSIAENPLNQLLRLGEFARYQWERDVMNGKITGLMSDIGPAANAWDTYTTLLSLGIVKPGQAIERGLLGITGGPQDRIAAAQNMANGMTVDEKYADDEFLQQIAGQIRDGRFGPVNDPDFRNKLLDEMVLNGQVTGNFFGDLGLSLITDPWVIASFGVGSIRALSSRAATTVSETFFKALPKTLEPLARTRTIEAAMRLTGETEDIAMIQYGKDAGLRTRVLTDVARQPEFAEHMPELLTKVNFLERWSNKLEPALRPVFNVVDQVNNIPFVFGKEGPAAKAMQTIFNRHSTEGVINGIGGLEGWYALGNKLRAVNPGLFNKVEDGIGIYTGNLIRLGMRADLVERAKREAIDFAKTPKEYILGGLEGLRGKSMKNAMEMMAARFKPLYGGTEEALGIARQQAADRLTRMGMEGGQAAEVVKNFTRDDAAFIDAAYFGHIAGEFVRAGRKAGTVADNFTPLGPRQITDVRANDVLAAIEAGQEDEVRDFVRRYDLLFENLSERNLSRGELFSEVKEIIDHQMPGIPKELTPGQIAALPPDLAKWAADNADLGYKVGQKPPDDELWRPTTIMRDGKPTVVAVNPWVDLVDTMSESVGKVSWVRAARSRAFREVRGQRILMDARHRLTLFADKRFGIPRAQADALFDRIMKAADEQQVAPRGLSGSTLFKVVQTSDLPREITDRMGETEIVEMFMHAFKGDFWHTGLTQSFTGNAKEWLGLRTNWLGVIAESVYPKVRYLYNPLFQLQELVEPFILNVMRGVRPGFNASMWDDQTLDLLDISLHQSRYASDDQIERTAVVLRDMTAAHETAGPGSVIGRGMNYLMSGGPFTKGITAGGSHLGPNLNIPSVRRIKEVNYARLQRKLWGQQLKESILRRNPQEWAKMEQAYRTYDAGQIAVRYMSEHLNLRMRNLDWNRGLFDMLKPAEVGALHPVIWKLMAHHFDDIPAVREAIEKSGTGDGGAVLRQMVHDRLITDHGFKAQILEQGGDSGFAQRAYRQAMLGTGDEWWTAIDALQPGASEFRPFYQVAAQREGMAEDEFLAHLFADLPMGADAEELAALSTHDQKVLQLAQRLNRPIPTDADLATREIDRMRTIGRISPVEYATVLDADGNNVYTKFGDIMSVQIPLRRFGMKWMGGNEEVVGGVIGHTHTNFSSLSGNDIMYGPATGAREVLASPHGAGAVLRPGARGWDTPEFVEALRQAVSDRYDRAVAAGSTPMDYRHVVWGDASTLTRSEDGMGVTKIGQNWLNEMLVGTDPNLSAYTDPSGLIGKHFHFLSTRFDLGGQAEFDFLEDHMRLARLAHNLALEEIADRFGWEYKFVWDPSLPIDRADYAAVVGDAYRNPATYLDGLGELDTAGLNETNLPAWDLSYEVEPGSASMRERMIPWDDLAEHDRRFVTDSTEALTRSMTESLAAVVVSDSLHGHGLWQETGQIFDNANIVHRVHGVRQQIRVAAALDGLVNQQTEVMASRLRPELDIAGPGQRWAIDIVQKRPLMDEAYPVFMHDVRHLLPEGGMAPIRYADGSSGLRMIFTDLPEGMTIDEFAEHADLERMVGRADAQRKGYEVKASVVDFESVRNDWSENAGGEAYFDLVARETEGHIRPRVVNRWIQRHNGALDTALQARLGEPYRAHVRALQARGELPRFRAYADPLEAPSAKSTKVIIPSHAGQRPFSLNEQHVINSLRIDPQAFYDADPLQSLKTIDSIQMAKNRTAEELVPIRLRNGFMFSVFTPQTMLPFSEVHATRFRAPVDYVVTRAGKGPLHSIDISHADALGEFDRMADNAVGRLPEDLQDSPQDLGMAAQVNLGWRLQADRAMDVPESIAREAGWLDKEGMVEVMQAENARIHEAIRGIEDPAQRDTALRAAVEESNARIRPPSNKPLHYTTPGGRDVVIDEGLFSAHPFDASRFPGAPEDAVYVTVASPFVGFRTQSMSQNLGYLLTWHKTRFFSDPKFTGFLKQQPWESRDQFLLRVGSVLPGIAAKTSGMTGSALGPALSSLPPLDVHSTRSIYTAAIARGDVDELLSRVSDGFGKRLSRSLDELTTTGRTSWPTPQVKRIRLLPAERAGERVDWKKAIVEDRDETLRLMRERLQRAKGLTDEQKAMYSDDVLEAMAQMNGEPAIMALEGSDYEVMIEFLMRKRDDDVAELLARNQTEAADLLRQFSPSQYQWHDWTQVRGGRLGWLDPHLTLSKNVEHLPRSPDLNAGESVDVMSIGTKARSLDPYAPEATFDPGATEMNFHRQNGTIMGFNALTEDNRRIIGITQEAEPRTIFHELVHPWERLLQPSQREQVLEAYRKAKRSKVASWNENVSEFWVDEVLRATENGAVDNPLLVSPMAHYATVARDEIMKELERDAKEAAKAAKRSTVVEARAAVKAADQARTLADRAVVTSERVHAVKLRAYQRARARTSVDVLEGKRIHAELALEQGEDARRDALRRLDLEKANRRDLRGRLASADPVQRGGLTRSLRSSEVRIGNLEAELANARAFVGPKSDLREAKMNAVKLHNAAKRRKDVGLVEQPFREAQADLAAAKEGFTAADEALAKARQQLGQAEKAPAKMAKVTYTPGKPNPVITKILDDLFPLSKLETRPGTGISAAVGFNQDQEAFYQVARTTLQAAEEEAFTTHYYKRGRNFVERSINHQYFGLYPASYMWGKILPEMLKFLLKEPFGIRAPLGGLALMNQVHRAMVIEQNFNEDFRKKMVEKTPLWRFFSLLAPALPWEIPVNAPLWLRRAAELDATRQMRIAQGEAPEDIPHLTGHALGNIASDMAIYAIGPLQTLKTAGDVLGLTSDISNNLFQTVSGVLTDAQTDLTAPGSEFAPFRVQAPTTAGPAQPPAIPPSETLTPPS